MVGQQGQAGGNPQEAGGVCMKAYNAMLDAIFGV